MLQFIDIEGWQSLHQFLSIIFLKKFIELSVKRDMMIKNARLLELNISIGIIFLNIKKL